MADYNLYHGTPYASGKELLTKGKAAVRLPHPSAKELFNGPKLERFGSVGSLGYGFYTFLEDADLARAFANKFANGKGTLVLQMRGRLDDDKTLRFDCSPKDIKRFRDFLNNSAHAKDIEHLSQKYSNSGFQKSLDGALLELYCVLMKEGNIADINAICSPTNSDVGVAIPDAELPNGIEVLVKDREIILDDKFKVVHN